MSQADIDNCPDEQAHDLKQQNVTAISIEAEVAGQLRAMGTCKG